MLKDFIAFDLEMPNQSEPSISAIGITVVKGGKIVDRIYSLINPEAEFSDYVIELIGITPEMVAESPTLDEYWGKIKKYFTPGDVLVAHSAYGDLLVLVRALERYGIKFENEIRYLCTCDMTLEESPELEHHTLDYLCESLGIELSHHNAQSDSDGCALVLLNYIEKGTDVEKYIKTESGKEIVSRHHRRAFGKAVKGITRRIKKDVKFAKGNLSLEKRIKNQISKGTPSSKTATINRSLVREDCRVLGIDDDYLKRFSKQMGIEDIEEVLSKSIFFTYEMYRIYIFLFNRFGYDTKKFFIMLSTLPSYYAIEGIDIEAVKSVFADFDLESDVLIEELIKRNIYGFSALAVFIMTETSYWKKKPEITLKMLDYLSKNKFSTEPTLLEKYSALISRLIVNGEFDDKLNALFLPTEAMRLGIKLAISAKPTQEERIRKNFEKYLHGQIS